MPRVSSTPTRSVYEPSSQYIARKYAPLPQGYVAVHSSARNAKVHVVKAGGWMELAKQVARVGFIRTECDLAVHDDWAMISRKQENGYLISCNHCRYRVMEGR